MSRKNPFLDSLDRMSFGALVLDSSGAILERNGHADRVLRAALPPNGSGEADAEWSRTALKRLLAQAGGRFRVDEEAWITIPRDGEAPLVLHAIPIGGERIDGPHTMLVFVDLANRPRPSAAALQRLFDLSPAEAKLAIEIGSGKPLSAVAAQTKVSNATLRTQLSAVFTKTGTRRQPELVALLARVAILP